MRLIAYAGPSHQMSTNTTLVWSHSLVESLIDLYREHECLWSVRSKEFKNRNAKEQAMVKIVEALIKKLVCRSHQC